MALPNTGLLKQLPAELRTTMREYLSDFSRAVTAPYVQEEVAWLGSNADSFAVFSSSEDGHRCDVALCKGGGAIPYERVHRLCEATLTGTLHADISSELEHRGRCSICMGKHVLFQQLVDRHGPEISREYIWDALGSGETTSTTILLDVHSYFALIRRRLESLGHARPTEEARKRTMDYLTSVALFYRSRPAALELCLLSSLHLYAKHSFRVIYDACEYGYVDNPAYMVRLRNNCEKYQERLRAVIAKMGSVVVPVLIAPAPVSVIKISPSVPVISTRVPKPRRDDSDIYAMLKELGL